MKKIKAIEDVYRAEKEIQTLKNNVEELSQLVQELELIEKDINRKILSFLWFFQRQKLLIKRKNLSQKILIKKLDINRDLRKAERLRMDIKMFFLENNLSVIHPENVSPN